MLNALISTPSAPISRAAPTEALTEQQRGARMAEQRSIESAPWDPELFLRFEAERNWPARDLIARIEQPPTLVYDLGCGPASSTRELLRRFPQTEVIGVDSSPRMLEEARRRLPDVTFLEEDISHWVPERRPDLIFADSALQWAPHHESLFPRLMDILTPGGVLAVQMPDNRQEPSHALMRLIAADGPWADRLVPIAKTRAVIATHTDYYNWLRPVTERLEIWQTTYVHPVDGVDAVVDWFRGSALLPFLAPLGEGERQAFLERYRAELADAYTVEPDGRLLFLYPRLFILATKRG
jgi:trans-aconitate 2-methyltransferase